MRCKMHLRSISHELGSVSRFVDGKKVTEAGKVASLTFTPVYHKDDPAHENSKFWSATPGGELKLNVVNADAVDGLEVGAEYYVDITVAPKP